MVEYLAVTAGIIAVITLVVAPLLVVRSCAVMTTAVNQIGR